MSTCRPSEDFSEICGDRKIVDMAAQGITEYVETSNEDTCIIGTSKLRGGDYKEKKPEHTHIEKNQKKKMTNISLFIAYCCHLTLIYILLYIYRNQVERTLSLALTVVM